MGKAVTKKGVIDPFVPGHASTYGLRIMELCPTTSRVISVRCQFCVYFGFDDDPTKPCKRGHKTTNMTWTSFRSDNYQHHHDTQHTRKWHEYQASSFEEKSQFFRHIPHANTLHAHINTTAPFKLVIQLSIVDTLIGDIFFHPDDQGGTTHMNVLKLFKRVDSKNGVNSQHYQVFVLNSEQFRLVIANIAGGMSFQQCVRNHNDIKQIFGTHSRLCIISN